MKQFFICALVLCSQTQLFSQKVIWQEDIESSYQDFLSQVSTTIDQQYLLTGSSIQSKKPMLKNGRSNGYDIHIVKLDQNGKKDWEKFFSGDEHDFLSATIATQEGGFLLAATSYSGKGLDKKEPSRGGSDIWLIRIDESGNEMWQKTLGMSRDEEVRSIVQTTDFGFLVAGNVNKAKAGYGSKDVIVTRLDKNGEILSELLLGGRGLDEVQSMTPTPDGGALLGIYSRSGSYDGSRKASNRDKLAEPMRQFSKTTENFGEGDYWIIKLDIHGLVEWERNYGGDGDDVIRSIAVTPSGYVIGGSSRSKRSGNKKAGLEEGADIWLLSINENGDEIWQKSFNFKNRDILTAMNIVTNATGKISKGILLGGYTQAEGRIEKDDETFWLLYMDENGNEKWRKHVKGESKMKVERLSDLRFNKDGSIVLAGTSSEVLGNEHWKIVKIGDTQIEQLLERQNIKIYPNPVSDYAYVEIGFDFGEADILLYDMGGRKIQELKTRNKITKIDTRNLIQGAYLIVVKTDTAEIANSKIIKK